MRTNHPFLHLQVKTLAMTVACVSGVLLHSQPAAAQGTLEDYTRAYGLYDKYRADKTVFHSASNVKWAPETHLFRYTIQTEGGSRTVVVNAENGESKTFEKSEEAEQYIASQSGKSNEERPERPDWRRGREEENLPARLRKPRKERHWMETDDELEGAPVLSPDGAKYAYMRDYNIYVCDKDGNNEKALTMDGTLAHYYSCYIQWSPDSKKISFLKVRPVSEKRYVYYVEAAPSTQLQPILHKQEYCKPGDELPFHTPYIIDVTSGKTLVGDTKLCDQQYELRTPQWNSDSKGITLEYNQRGHKIFRILEMSAETGAMRTVVEESYKTFVNYSRYFRQDLQDGKQIIWMSERDNWNHLYLIDRPSGKVKKQITKGEWVVRRVLNVDEENQTIYFSASGVNPKEDPYQVHYYRIGFDGKNMVALTPADGEHRAEFSGDYKYLVDTYSKVDAAPVTELRDATTGALIKTLETADISKLKAAGWTAPEIFTAPGRDGKTEMWGIIQRPSNFDPNKKYPVIEYIYAGPGDAYTPKSFMAYNWNMTPLAELGFIVVQLDAMGTSYRGKAFEDVCYKNLKDAGFPDRECWIKAAAAKYPYMDADRVGIFGASAGGQESTTAVLLHPDFYKAAYSSCGCHDNRMDKIWWNEQWMGYPIDSAYVECSNVYNAHKLTRPLMLVVGELDDNVDPASTMQVVDELIKNNKDFELVVMPGVHHTMGERYGEHKRFDFFVKNLLKVVPPTWSEVEEATKK